MMTEKTKKTTEDSLNQINIDNFSDLNNIKFSYIKIDSSNIFKKISNDEIKSINKRIEKYDKKKKIEFTNEFIKSFLEKLYYKSDLDSDKIISLISSKIKSKKKLNENTIEPYLNYFYDSRDKYKASNTLVLDKSLFKKIGILLSYIYSKLKEYSIDSKGIKEYIDIILIKKINILTDYFIYCGGCGADPMLLKKAYEWKKLVDIYKYKIPPEFIFLINIFQDCSKLEIDIEFDENILEREDLHLFAITLLNIEYVFPNLENISISLAYNKLQTLLNQRYFDRIYTLLSNKEETLKKNFVKDDISMYEIKWDFNHEFNLGYFNEIKRSIKRNKQKISLEEYCIISKDEEKERELLQKNNSILMNSSTLEISTIDKSNAIDDIGFIDLDLDEEDKESVSSSTLHLPSTDNVKVKNKEIIKEKKENKKLQYLKSLEKNSIVFDIILMTFFCISSNKSVRKINILSNDYYSKDLINFLKTFYNFENKIFFHLFDFLFNKADSLDLLNIELNSLDVFTFKKILEIFSINNTIASINISFFSSDVSYLLPNLFKIYSEQIKTQKMINEYLLKIGKNFTSEVFENKILDDICETFIDRLSMLFEILKNKSNLKELGINFDIPDILIKNNKYKISIYKFILNIILMVNNNEIQNYSNLKKLTLLSPKLILDKKLGNNIDIFLKNISLYKTSKTLMNLNIQFQFHKISYIKNMISPNLFILNLGDLDIFSFYKLVIYLTSYKFSIQSNLSQLGIKLIGSLINFNTQLKLIFQKLFNINLRNLLELKLFTNLIINKKADYLFLMKLLQNNWIPSYIITLNEKSKKTVDFFKIFGRKKIPHLVSESIQNIIFKDDGNFITKKNDFPGNQIYWILKYIFICKYKNNSVNLGNNEIQKLTFTILKYLFLTRNIKLEHQLNLKS